MTRSPATTLRIITCSASSARPPKTVKHKPAVCRGGVGPCVAERAETGFLFGDRRERVQQVAGRAREAVETRHHYHIAGGEFGDKTAKLRPVGLGSARHLTEHLARAGGAKLPGLSTLWPPVETRA
jgi:hypothetical protein